MNLINPKDFQIKYLVFEIENATSGTKVPDLPRNFSDRISILELQEQGFVLGLPVVSCAVGHLLSVTITVEGLAVPMKVHFTGKVISSSMNEKNGQQVEILLTQFEKYDWERFQKYFTADQNKITKFLNETKGEE